MDVNHFQFETGLIIHEFMRRAKKRQIDLAPAIRTVPSQVSALLNGKRPIDLLEFIRVAEVCGVDPIQMFERVVAIAPRADIQLDCLNTKSQNK